MFEQTSMTLLSIVSMCTGFIFGVLAGIVSAFVILFIKKNN